MKTQIENLIKKVNGASTITIEGRQTVSTLCEELYRSIEQDIYDAGSEWMLKGIYEDLCKGNFAEPFMCEKKKETFMSVVEIYNTRILPRL